MEKIKQNQYLRFFAMVNFYSPKQNLCWLQVFRPRNNLIVLLITKYLQAQLIQLSLLLKHPVNHQRRKL